MNNPLLNPCIIVHEINFEAIEPNHFVDAFKVLIPEVKQEHQNLVENGDLDYFALFEHYPKRRQLGAVVHILNLLNSVVQTPELRQIYNDFVPEISALFQEMSLDQRAYFKIKDYQKTGQYQCLTPLYQKMISDILFEYELGGINLPEEQKQVLQDIAYRLSELTTLFENNLKDVEEKLEMTVSRAELKGIPERAFNNAQPLENDHYLISHSSGIYDDILTFCEVEETRKKIYEQLLDLGVKDGSDNRPVLEEIAKLKQQTASILGYSNYAQLALVKSMVKTPAEVLEFIGNLAEKSYPAAQKESQKVNEFGEKLLGRPLNFYDRGFTIEKMKQQLFSVDSEKLREYFPVRHVIKGLFFLVEELYSVKFVENKEKSVWHLDVTVYDVVDTETQEVLGTLYMDLYKRKFKSSGAWMDPAVTRNHNIESLTLPVAYIVCNAPKDAGREATFTFGEIITLFHEMGHALHHLLTEVNIEYYSGINHVQHDAVELPSQFMENFCWDYEIIKEISSHVTTGEVLPKKEFDKKLAMKNFLSASQMLRQATFSEIDIRIYNEPESSPLAIEKEIFTKWATRPLDQRSYFIPSFSHIFAGGYSAGYYAYKWAEVLSADAFAALREAGNTYREQRGVAIEFRKNILAKGGAEGMQENFVAFRGRKPDVKYLLQDSGIEIAE